VSKRSKLSNTGAMLELWRPPQAAGDAVGCLTTTYTFSPGIFDEQCLGRFLDIESDPNREDLAFLLERESRLGGTYAGVMVDHTQAGVEHSLRWDVLPVRIVGGKQHAKLTLLAWTRHVRIIVASANASEPGYRTNREVAACIDLTPEDSRSDLLADAIGFLENLLSFVPGFSRRLPEVRRAQAFLNQVMRQAKSWQKGRESKTVRQQLTFTLPAVGEDQGARSSLSEAMEACRRRGASPNEAWVASPFFDVDEGTNLAAAALCKAMARGVRRDVYLCVRASRDADKKAVPRLFAPKSLLTTPAKLGGHAVVEILPDEDEDKNPRIWHAKMLALHSDQYCALMVGSSNFTSAGLGLGGNRNAEANLLTIVDRADFAREEGKLKAVWPAMDEITDPHLAEWLGARPESEEEEKDAPIPLPPGFISATFRAGEDRKIILRLEWKGLPSEWRVDACGQGGGEVLSAGSWALLGRPSEAELAWSPNQPPEKLHVRWDVHEGFLPINVEDSYKLPPPARLENMTADDMLWILASADPSAAFRTWAKRQQPNETFDSDLDSATPTDLDPLRRHDLHATFLHRIGRRARILAQLRANLQRPVSGRQALEWRLRGLIGVESLAERFAAELCRTEKSADEGLLALADFLIVLREVDYRPDGAALSKPEFERTFRSFVRDLAEKLRAQVATHNARLSNDVQHFWARVLEQCLV
jgi:hypothetical protein